MYCECVMKKKYLSKNFRNFLIDNHLVLGDIAKKADLSPQSFSDWLNGKVVNPRASNLRRLRDVINRELAKENKGITIHSIGKDERGVYFDIVQNKSNGKVIDTTMKRRMLLLLQHIQPGTIEQLQEVIELIGEQHFFEFLELIKSLNSRRKRKVEK